MELMLSSVIELEMDCYGCRDQTINDYYVSVGWGHVTIVWMSAWLTSRVRTDIRVSLSGCSCYFPLRQPGGAEESYQVSEL